MNLFTMLNRGAAHAPAPKLPGAHVRAAEAARRQWLNALVVDETRAWLNLGEAQPDVLNGLTTLLTLAGFVHVFDARDADTLDVRIIRGAISTAEGCVRAGEVITANDAQAFSSAAARAAAIIRAGTVPAIIHASRSIRETIGLK